MSSRSKIVFMFGGQGTQYFHMGRELYASNRTFRAWLDRGAEFVQHLSKRPLLSNLFDPNRSKADAFDQILDTHPSIFLVEFALAQSLIESGVEPDLVLGYSLGEFAAAAVAGLISFEGALLAVVQQARMVSQHCPEAVMTAVMADFELVANEPALLVGCDIASINLAGHFVIAGLEADVRRAEAKLCSRSVEYSCSRLAVRHAFHSRWMDPLESRLEPVPAANLQAQRTPFASCTVPTPVTRFDRAHLWSVIRQPVRFADALGRLEQQSACTFIDLSPSGTLAAFVARAAICPNFKSIAAMTPFGAEQRTLARAAASGRALSW